MRIVFCVDEKYMKYAQVAIASYKKLNHWAWVITVSEKPIKGLGEDENIVFKLPKIFRNRGAGDRITNTAYLKCFLPEILKDHHKIIYVDADTICQHPLDELWNMPVKYINLCESHKFGAKQAQAIRAKKYGLTGMMVMNLDNLREIDFTKKCLEVEKTYPTPTTGWQHDETCINIALKDKLTFIDHKFNYCHNRDYTYPIPEKDAVILHFVGKDKDDMFSEKHYGKRYGKLKEVLDYIKGKSVAIVGNAKSIFGKLQGDEIDSHDVIIRFNKGFLYEPKSQGTRTDIVILACLIREDERLGYHAKYVINRSRSYQNPANFTISNEDRQQLRDMLGSQPSTGFMAIDLCRYAEAKSIDLYGFDFEATPTFYNPYGYKTQHDYSEEKKRVLEFQEEGILTIK